MVSLVGSRAVDRGLEPKSDQSKDYKIDICCFSAEHLELGSTGKDWFRVTCSRVTKCLPANCCIRALPPYLPESVGLLQSGHHYLIEM